MPPITLRLLRARLLVALVSVFALVACRVPSGELPQAPPAPRLSGAQGVVLAAGISPPELIAHDLSRDAAAPLRLPEGTEEVVAARWLDDGSALASLLGVDGARLFRLSTDGEPEAIGSPTGAPGVLDVRGDTVVSSSCRTLDPQGEQGPGRFEASGPDRQTGTIRVLSLDGGDDWRKVARGCLAALSPDADAVAHSPDGTSLWITGLDGSGSRKVFDVAEVELTAVSDKPFTIKGPVVWSEPGIALAIDADGSDAVVRLSSEGKLQSIVSLSPRARDFFVDLAWTPEGDQLAVAAYNRLAYVNVVGFVGVLGVEDDEPEVISVQPQLSDAVLWGPEGDALLVAGTGEPWVVTDLTGKWLERVPSADLLPLDWKP